MCCRCSVQSPVCHAGLLDPRLDVPGNLVEPAPAGSNGHRLDGLTHHAGGFAVSTTLRSNGPSLSTKNTQSEALSQDVTCR